MGTAYVYGYKNLQVFNFAILLDSWNSRKLSARENYVFYSIKMSWCESRLCILQTDIRLLLYYNLLPTEARQMDIKIVVVIVI